MPDEFVDRFQESLLLQVRQFELVAPDDPVEDALGDDASDIWGVAGELLSRQAIESQSDELEWFLRGGDDFAQDVLRSADGQALLLALFIVGREIADAVQLRNGDRAAGDHLGLWGGRTETVEIEVGARLGDFRLEWLVTWTQLGEDPADPGQGKIVTREVALLREARWGSDERDLADLRTRRRGLRSLGVPVTVYSRADARNDPFGFAARTLRELERETHDDLFT